MPRRLAVSFMSLLVAVSARAELDVLVGNGDVVAGTLLPATQRETLRFECPRGAKLVVTLASGRRRSALSLRLFGPDDAEIDSVGGRRVTLRPSALETGGVYSAQVASVDGATSDDYRFRVAWKSPRRQSSLVPVDASSVGELRFAAEAGARVRLTTSASRRSGVVPTLVRVEMPDGSVQNLAPGTSGSIDAPQTGEYVLTFENHGASGDVVATADVRPPRATKRRLAATTREIPAGTDVVASRVIGRAGGRVAATSTGTLAGAYVDLPADAVAKPRIVVIAATTADVTAPRFAKSTAATSAAFVGPDGLTFPAGRRPTVYLPAKQAVTSVGAQILRAYQQRSAGAATEVPGASYVASTYGVSFSPPQFGRFRAYYVESATVASLINAPAGYTEGLGDVAVGGGYAFVAAPGAAGPGGQVQAGYVHVFEHVGSTWIERAPLRAPSPAANDEFGYALAYRTSPAGIADDSLLVSSPQSADPNSSGVVHEFVLSAGSWQYLRTIASPSPRLPTSWVAYLGNFGTRIAVDGDVLVAPTRNPADFDHPDGVGVPVMRRGPAGWSLEQTLPLAVSNVPVAVRGTQVAAGIFVDRTSTPVTGDVNVYELSNSTATLGMRIEESSPSEPYSDFGQRLAMGDSHLAVGRGRMPPGFFEGRATPSVQLFRLADYGFDGAVAPPDMPSVETARSGWLPAGRTALGGFAFVGDTLVAGASRRGYDPIVEGGYVFRKRGGAWDTAYVLDVSRQTGDADIARLVWSSSDHVGFDGRTAVVPIRVQRLTDNSFADYVAFFDVPSE